MTEAVHALRVARMGAAWLRNIELLGMPWKCPWKGRFHGIKRVALMLVGALLLSACNPAMDWREYRIEESGFSASFPQKPGKSERRLDFAGTQVPMRMVSVSVDKVVYGVGVVSFNGAVPREALQAFRDVLARGMQAKVEQENALPAAEAPDGGSVFTLRSATHVMRVKLVVRKADVAGPVAAAGSSAQRSTSSAGPTASTPAASPTTAPAVAATARLYQVAWVAPIAQAQNADHDLFFNSFKLR
jgi:hypothetical protein